MKENGTHDFIFLIRPRFANASSRVLGAMVEEVGRTGRRRRGCK